MPHKLVRMQRADAKVPARPVMLAIAGDSAAGKTTITRGLVQARAFADIVIRFAPPASPSPFTGRRVPAGTPLSAELLLRPTIRHPDLDGVVPDGTGGGSRAIHLRLARDADGRPVDALYVHGDAAREDSEVVEKAIWSRLGADAGPPACLGRTRDGQRTEPLAITQLLLVYHLLDAAR